MSLFVDIEKRLGTFTLRIQLQTDDSIIGLLGASGSGKSLTLRCIAGIERPDRGRIVIDGETVFDSERNICLPPQKRRVGLLFQNYALFPNMTVLQNLLQGTLHRKNRAERMRCVNEMLERFSLTEQQNLYPHQLSGGQQQRTAIARMLLSQPSLIALDEPFSALDAHLRAQLERDMAQTLREYGKHVLFVSHEPNEIYRLCDCVAVMQNGSIVELGEKHALFARPQSVQTARLLGMQNIARANEWGLDGEHLVAVREDAVTLDAKEGIACDVLSCTEDFDSVLLELHMQKTGGKLFARVDKDAWSTLPRETVFAHIDRASIITLRGDLI